MTFMMLEQFYQCLYYELLYYWIISNKNKYIAQHIDFQVVENTPDFKILLFKLDKVYGNVTIWSNNIIEEEIHRNHSEELLFYLHFTIIDIAQASHLFDKFYQSLLKENNQKEYHIAFCCTGGFSTSLFIERMQEVCDLENIHFHLYSLSTEDLYQTYSDYDVIYLAPQIAYMQPHLMKLVHNHIPIHRIDATDFATNNFHAIIKTIQTNLINDQRRF